MAIRVNCPNGHRMTVKEKYAGKTGKCPQCGAKVQVPRVDDDSQVSNVLDDYVAQLGSGASNIQSTIVERGHHEEQCSCGEYVMTWYASCPSCGRYLDH